MPEENVSQAAQPVQVKPEGAQVQQPTTPPVSAPITEPQTEQKPLTLETVREMIQTEATRIAQSQVAKGENRIQRSIQEQFAALDKTKGVLGLTDQQVKQARQDIVTQAYTEPEPQVADVQTNVPSANPEVDTAIQFLNTQISNVFKGAGVDAVTAADPEMTDLQKVIDDSWNDPNGLTAIILAANTAAQTKKTRLQTQTETAAARVISAGGSQSGGGSVSGTGRDMLTQAYSAKK